RKVARYDLAFMRVNRRSLLSLNRKGLKTLENTERRWSVRGFPEHETGSKCPSGHGRREKRLQRVSGGQARRYPLTRGFQVPGTAPAPAKPVCTVQVAARLVGGRRPMMPKKQNVTQYRLREYRPHVTGVSCTRYRCIFYTLQHWRSARM